jgi:hypothetical protein
MRALLVTHWSLAREAVARLTTSTFDRLDAPLNDSPCRGAARGP